MRNRLLVIGGGLFVAATCHFLVWRSLPALGPALDFFLIATLLAALGGPLQGMLVGAFAGVVADSVSGAPFGTFGFANTLTGYFVGLAASRVAEMTETSVLILTAVGALLQRVALAAVLAAFVSLRVVPAFWSPMVILTATALVFVVRTLVRNVGRFVGWRRGRQAGKLGM